MNADELAACDYTELGLALAQLAARDPNHLVVVAIRVVVADIAGRPVPSRREHHEISRAISEGFDWRRIASIHVPYAELQRRRAQPGPMHGGTAA